MSVEKPAATRRFELAGLAIDAEARGPGSLDSLNESYDRYERSDERPPDVAIRLVFDESHSSPPSTAEYPAFDMARDGDELVLWRKDAAGRIFDVDGVTHASFQARSDTILEAAFRVTLATALVSRGGLVMHASTVNVDGGALVFAGQSGAGKSTISDLLADAGNLKLTDELVALRHADDGWRAFVMPFFGHPDLPFGHVAPLRAVHFLSHGPHHERSRLDAPAAVRAVLRNTLSYAGRRAIADGLLATAADLVAHVPCFSLEFARTPSVATVVRAPLDRASVRESVSNLVVAEPAD